MKTKCQLYRTTASQSINSNHFAAEIGVIELFTDAALQHAPTPVPVIITIVKDIREDVLPYLKNSTIDTTIPDVLSFRHDKICTLVQNQISYFFKIRLMIF